MKVHMEFTFPDREEKDLEHLNAMLSSMKWSEVRLEDFNGYHEKTSTRDQNTGEICSVTHRYGCDQVVLECEREDDEPGYRYQVETEYLTQAISSDEYHDCWSEEHPDYVMRVLSCISFDDGGSAFVVLFHEKVK